MMELSICAEPSIFIVLARSEAVTAGSPLREWSRIDRRRSVLRGQEPDRCLAPDPRCVVLFGFR